MNTLDWNLLIGKPAVLCAVEMNKFRLGDLTLEAIEDEMDGYRSALSELRIVDNIRPMFQESVIIRKMQDIDSDGIELVNNLNFVVLRVGTRNVDDYYPYFVFQWNPTFLTGLI